MADVQLNVEVIVTEQPHGLVTTINTDTTPVIENENNEEFDGCCMWLCWCCIEEDERKRAVKARRCKNCCRYNNYNYIDCGSSNDCCSGDDGDCCTGGHHRDHGDCDCFCGGCCTGNEEDCCTGGHHHDGGSSGHDNWDCCGGHHQDHGDCDCDCFGGDSGDCEGDCFSGDCSNNN